MPLSKEKAHASVRKKPAFTGEVQALQNPQLFRLTESGLDLQTALDIQAYAPGGGSGALTIGAVDSPMEQEADRMADRVLSGQTELKPQLKVDQLSRLPELPGQQQGEEEMTEIVMGKREVHRSGSGSLSTPGGFESKLSSRQGLGSPLQGKVKNQMESGFGSDLSHVRLHTDSEADQMSRDIGAKAFTYGQDIYFKGGAYDPGSSGGQRLIAHELTHTFQQSKGVAAKRIQRVPDEPQKYDLDYPAVIEENIEYWRFLVRNIDPFGLLEINPYNRPIAFANKTYEFQQNLNKILLSYGDEHGYPESGIFDNGLFDVFERLGKDARDPQAYKFFSDKLGGEIVDQAVSKFSQTTDQPELISEWFKDHGFFKLVRKYPSITLRKGDKGTHVHRLQLALMALNYPLPVHQGDGKFGEETREALKEFQMDEGFKPHEVTGILDAQTLQRLDVRMYGKKYFPKYSSGGKLVRVYNVPVPYYMPKDEFTLFVFQQVFSISEREARVLFEDGWHLIHYKEINTSMIEVGHTSITCDSALVEMIKGKRFRSRYAPAKGTRAISAEKTLASLEELILSLNERGYIIDLIKKADSKKELIKEMEKIEEEMPPEMQLASDFELSKRAKREWKAAQAELDRELAKYGTTRKELLFQRKKFKQLFGTYAHFVARKMLEDNRTSVLVERRRYDDPINASTPEGTYIKEIKEIIRDLQKMHQAADQFWWDGLSYEETGDKNKVNSQSKLRSHAGPRREGKMVYDPVQIIKNKYFAYSPEKLPKSTPNSYFKKGVKKEKEAIAFLSQKAQKYQVLAFPGLRLRYQAGNYLKMSDDALRLKLLGTLDAKTGILKKIDQVEAALKDKAEIVYSLGPVLAKAQEELGILPGSYPAKLVKESITAYKDDEFWRDIGMAALGIGLGMLALVSGPIGWAALGGSIAVGVYDSYQQYQKISFAKAAKRSAMDPRKALGDTDPSYFWFYVSVLAIGIDVFDVVKLLKPAKLAMDAAKGGEELAQGLTKALREEQAELEKLLVGKTGAEATEIGDKIAKIKQALADIDPDELAKNFEVLRHVSKSPQASLALAEGLRQPEIAQAFTRFRALKDAGEISKDTFIHVVQYFGGFGRRYLHEMPEMLRLAESGGLVANSQLFREVMSDSRLQKVLLDNNTDPGLLLSEWQAWKAAGKGSGTFVDFLAKKGHRVTLESGPSLSKTFGMGFAAMGVAQKNRYVLREVHPDLLSAYNRGQLPPKVMAGMEELLQKDIIGTTNDLTRATMRIEREVQAVLTTHLDSLGELTQALRMLRGEAIRKAVFEGASQVKGYDSFKKLLDDNARLIARVSKDSNDNVFDDLIRIGPIDDNDTMLRLIREKDFRNTLLEYPDTIKALKKCASPCFPPTATPTDIMKVGSIIRKIKRAGGEVDYSKINEFLYNARGDGFADTVANLQRLTGKKILAFLNSDAARLSSVVVPDGMRAAVKNIDGKITELLSVGIAPKQLSEILAKFEHHGLDATDALARLIRASRKVQGQQFKYWSELLNMLGTDQMYNVRCSLALLKKLGNLKNNPVARVTAMIDTFKMQHISKGLGHAPSENQWMTFLDEVAGIVNQADLNAFLAKARFGRVARLAGSVRPKRFALAVSEIVRDTKALKNISELFQRLGRPENLAELINNSPPATLNGMLTSTKPKNLARLIDAGGGSANFTAFHLQRLVESFAGNYPSVAGFMGDLQDLALLRGLHEVSKNLATSSRSTFANLGDLIPIAKIEALSPNLKALAEFGNNDNRWEGIAWLISHIQQNSLSTSAANIFLEEVLERLPRFGDQVNTIRDGSRPVVDGTAIHTAGLSEIRTLHFQSRHTWDNFSFEDWLATTPRKETTFFPPSISSEEEVTAIVEETFKKFNDSSGTLRDGVWKNVSDVPNPFPPPDTLDIRFLARSEEIAPPGSDSSVTRWKLVSLFPTGPLGDAPLLTNIPPEQMEGISRFF